MKSTQIFLLASAFLCIANIALAQSRDSVFMEAGRAYSKGDYQTAATLYQSILSKGFESAELYNNLANSYYKQNLTAPSILAYNRALRLAPNDKEIQRNLSIAQLKTSDKIIPLGDTMLSRTVKSIHSSLPIKAWGWISMGLSWVCLGLFVVYLLSEKSGTKRSSFYLTIILGIAFIGVYTIHRIAADEYHNSSLAVVFAANANAKSEPSPSGADVFTIHEGTRVMVLEELNAWSKVRLEDGKIAWLPNADIEKI